jgi:hypothetical protein
MSGVDFRRTLGILSRAFTDLRVEPALIGGVALAALGVARTTGDVDFLAPGERADDIDRALHRLGYEPVHRSRETANYVAEDPRLGRVDFLFANRKHTRAMLTRAKPHRLFQEVELRVVDAEDLIGLKVQSAVNDPTRERIDVDDIRRLLEARGRSLDIERIREYFRIFDREAELDALLASLKGK